MKRRLFLAIGAIGMGVLAAACSPEKKAEQKAPPTEVRLAVHKSFDLPQPLITKFEQENHAKVNVIKVGGGGELVNKLILSRAKPVADAVFGLDNTTSAKAREAGVLADNQPASAETDTPLYGALAVDYGYVTLNYDKAWFEKHRVPLPKSLDDLATPAYKNLLAVPSPATSGAGLGFLLANIQAMGEEKALAWWGKMRANGVKVTPDWNAAYYTEFSQNGGARPLVVSYATSPAAEVFFSKGKYTEPPTGNLFLQGGVFRQVEGAAVLRGAEQPELAAKLVQYLQNGDVQKAIPEAMWVYPAVKGTPLPPSFKSAEQPKFSNNPSEVDIQANRQRWVEGWLRVVEK